MKTIQEWLASIGLEEYAARFAANAIDLSTVTDLDEQDLINLGVLLGHRRKMLRAIAQLLEAGGAIQQGETRTAPRDDAERRLLTLMFCDMVGSSALTARLDPEDMRQVISSYHAAIGDTVQQHGGIVARYMGDGALVYFGYPGAHEDDAEQAVRAGLALIKAMPDLSTNPDMALQVRIGIATGTVVVGDLVIGEQTVVGDAANLAQRLQSIAEPGTVLICANTRRLSKGYFNLRELGLLTLKGWPEPVPIWQVLERSGVESRFQATHGEDLSPLLGREEETELLLRRWHQAKQGEGRVVVLTGEPGIGKSHLALAFAEQIQSEPQVTLRYYCSAHHTNSVLFPIIRQLERAAKFEHTDTPDVKIAKLESLLSLSTTDATHVALVANILSIPFESHHSLAGMSPQERKEMSLRALLAQLDGLAAKQPVLMVFEDVHWIDPTSLELLSAIVERASCLRLLVLLTARPEFTPPWPSYAHTTTIPLTRLDRRNGTVLIERVARGKMLPEEVLSEILVRTDGVPLFVEELTKTILESGMLRQQGRRYVLTQPLPALAIPTTLNASLMARLDRLSPVREVAQIGAVVGREFSYELLLAVAGLPEGQLEEVLSELVRSGLVFQRGEIPHAVYTFKHVLVRDAAYASLLKSRCHALHGTIATVLEQDFPEIVQRQPETLARHFTEAGLFGQATQYWLRAGTNSALRSANVEAIANLRRGLEIVSRLPEGSDRDKTELDFKFALGPCIIATRGPASAEALETFNRARELCERLGEPPEYSQVPEYLQVMFWLTTANVICGRLLEAHEMIKDLLQLAKSRNNRPALINAMRGHAMILLFMGSVRDAHNMLERAIDAFDASNEADRLSARAAGQDAGVADLSLMSWALWVLGYVDQAATQIAAAVQRANDVQHPHSQAYACYYASVLHAFRDEHELACNYANRCIALSEEHGFSQWRDLSRAIRGICLGMQKDSSAPLDEVRRALERYRTAGYQLGVTALVVLLGAALLLRNQPDAALEVIDQGLNTANSNNERLFEAEMYRLKAKALLARSGQQDETSDYRSFIEQALRVSRNQKARLFELRAAIDLAVQLVGQKQNAEALDMIEPIYNWFTEGLETRDLMNAKSLVHLCDKTT